MDGNMRFVLSALTAILFSGLTPTIKHSEAPTVSSTVATTATTTTIPVDPILALPKSVQDTIACIAYVESRSVPGRPHLVDTSYAGAEGMYQFMPDIWTLFRTHSGIAGIPLTPNEATQYQQDEAIVWFYHRNAGFRPEWSGDFSCAL